MSPAKPKFDELINRTTEAFSISSGTLADSGATLPEGPRLVNNRQSVYKVPLSMVRPDRFQARFMLPYALREGFYKGARDWRQTLQLWQAMGESDPLIQRELEELAALGESLHDVGQIKPVTGQVVQVDGRDVFMLLTGERRFWATAIRALTEDSHEEPCVLALLDNAPSLEKQIMENMAYKELTPVGKARAAARLVLEANGLVPKPGQDETEYFRQVSELRLSEETRALLQKVLGMERTYYGRLMRFFELPPELLEAADRSEMPERVLRELIAYDSKHWQAAVLYYAEHPGRTYLDVHAFLERLVGRSRERAVRLPLDPATRHGRALRKALTGFYEVPQEDKAGAIADALLSETRKEDQPALLANLEALQEALRVRIQN